MEEKHQCIRGRHPNPVTVSASFLLHSSSALGLAITHWVAQSFFSINLISNPTQTLILLWEWPVCVIYGAVAGYLIGIVASLGFVLVFGERRELVKEE